MENREHGSFPKTIQIQTTFTCNNKCEFCPNKYMQNLEPKFMKLEDCKMLIDQCRGKDVKKIMPFDINEPLTYPHLLDFCEYANKVIPEAQLIIYTNAALLDKDMSKKLIDLGLSYIHFSVQGASAEMYKTVTGTDNYNKVVKNILDFIDVNKQNRNIPYTINLTVVETTQCQSTDFVEFWKLKGIDDDSIGVHNSTNRDRNYKKSIDKDVTKYYKVPCGVLFTDLFIKTNGDCSFCCEDWSASCKVGNVFESSIEQIWNNEIYNKYRNLHVSGRKKEISICKNCNSLH